MKQITVNTSKAYSVWIGGGLLESSGDRNAASCGGETAALVTDDVVDKLYGDVVERSLRAAGYGTLRFVFPHGEQSKNMETYVTLLTALTEAGLTRSDTIVALGGGVAGDLAGFAAATYLRGVRFAQMPTTLLAMVDSSVGGKTAVNLPAGKNQAGAFYQPDIVIGDIETMQTLPAGEFSDGCAEMIKHGVILSEELFDILREPVSPLSSRMEDVITRNITIKRDIVAEDEKETGVRQILNFGHTIGHGIEKHSGYSVSHGKAVAIGMVIAGRGAYRMGLCSEECYLDILGMVTRYQLPWETSISPALLFEAAFSDKKRSGQSITLILPERIGKCIAKSFGMDELEAFIRLGIQA